MVSISAVDTTFDRPRSPLTGQHQTMGEDLPLATNEFRATLYFDGPPHLSAEALIEAWGGEGYVCQRDESSGIFQGFRGGTYVIIGAPGLADRAPSPAFDAFDALNTVFSVGHLFVHGRRFRANEWLMTLDLQGRFASADRGKPILRVVVREYRPVGNR